jgi:hypothetical protein
MTNERARGRPSSPSSTRIWQTEVQAGVRLRLDLDRIALLTVFLAKTDLGTLIREAIHEYAINHQLDSTKQEIQEDILEKAEAFRRVGVTMTLDDYLSGKDPQEKLSEVALELKSVVAQEKKPALPKERKPIGKEMPNIAADPATVTAKVLDFGSQEKSTAETNLNSSNIGETDSAVKQKSFAEVLLERYSKDDDSY